MKKYIIFGLTLLMAFPLSVVAQDDDTEEEDLIETIARMEHDEYLKASKAADEMRREPQHQDEIVVETPEVEQGDNEQEENEGKKPKKKGIDLKKIVTSFTEFFTPDNIE